jgi:hypothetical protein
MLTSVSMLLFHRCFYVDSFIVVLDLWFSLIASRLMCERFSLCDVDLKFLSLSFSIHFMSNLYHRICLCMVNVLICWNQVLLLGS